MAIAPPYLKKGDTIAIACPAGYMSKEKAATCIRVLKEWGYHVKLGKSLGSNSKNYFSGTDDERLRDFQELLDDDNVKAILCARGGYGVSRIIDRIDFKKFRKKPKWIIGYSDITVLLSHIFSNFKIMALHGPMAAAFNDGEYKNEYVQSLRTVLHGKKAEYACPAHKLNRKGMVEGELVGGNLSLLAHLVGSKSDIHTKGKILFIEDVGEYQYNIDRMLRQLKRSNKLDKLKGLIIGKFSDTKDTERKFGQPVFEMIHDIIKEYDYPVCFDFPVSHTSENYALKIGSRYKLKISNSGVVLQD